MLRSTLPVYACQALDGWKQPEGFESHILRTTVQLYNVVQLVLRIIDTCLPMALL